MVWKADNQEWPNSREKTRYDSCNIWQSMFLYRVKKILKGKWEWTSSWNKISKVSQKRPLKIEKTLKCSLKWNTEFQTVTKGNHHSGGGQGETDYHIFTDCRSSFIKQVIFLWFLVQSTSFVLVVLKLYKCEARTLVVFLIYTFQENHTFKIFSIYNKIQWTQQSLPRN